MLLAFATFKVSGGASLKLLDQGPTGLLRDEGAVKIPGWVAHVQRVCGFSGNAYGCERSGCGSCSDLRERQECTRNRDRNRPVLQHPKITRKADSTICPGEPDRILSRLRVRSQSPFGRSTPPRTR